MKKVISLVLVVALFAALSVCASADVVTHAHNEEPSIVDEYPWVLVDCETLNTIYNIGTEPWVQDLAVTWAQELVRWSSQQVKVLDITEGVSQTWTTEAQAITAAELQAVCDADERINNLTVFYQRNIEEAEGAVDISIKLWPCNPEKKPNQATVILFRAEGTEEWTVAAYEAANEASAQLSGNGAYVVALAW